MSLKFKLNSVAINRLNIITLVWRNLLNSKNSLLLNKITVLGGGGDVAPTP